MGHRALLLSDTVPRGTGYLEELSTPGFVWAILVDALRILETCTCADSAAATCHRCVLPYVPSSARELTSRQHATEILGELLGIDILEPDESRWKITAGEIEYGDDFESSLEKRFRRVF